MFSPFDVWLPQMGDPRQPTTEQVDFSRNLGLFSCEEFGFGPGNEPPMAKKIEGLEED
jgi:hypothetical protein